MNKNEKLNEKKRAGQPLKNMLSKVLKPAQGEAPQADTAQPDMSRLPEDAFGPAYEERRSGIFSWFLFGLLFLSLYLIGCLAWPFLHTIIMACVFSALAYPLFSKIASMLGGRSIPAALLTLFFIFFIIAIPLGFFVSSLLVQGTASISAITQWLSSAHLDTFIADEVTPILAWAHEQFGIEIAPDQVRKNLLLFASRAGQTLLAWGTNFLSDSFSFATSFVLLFLIMFFLLKDGQSMLNGLMRLLPMRESQKFRILRDLRGMSRSVLIGGLSVAALQGLVGGIGLAIVGIPAMFWGTMMAFAALVPVVGTALVWAPAVAYLFIMGDWGSGVFLLIWCGLLVTSIDSFVRPILMRGSSNLSVLFLFMSVFGGIQFFGMLGLLYGPLILSFAAVMLHIYAEEYSEALYRGQHQKDNADTAGAGKTAENKAGPSGSGPDKAGPSKSGPGKAGNDRAGERKA